jgi:uncharacterized protein YmfQ (DUF2313 family)
MTIKELQTRLIKHSPFLLRTNVESEEQFSFTNENLYFNNQDVGNYLIKEEDSHFAISVKGSTGNMHQFEISLDYKGKPVVLFMDNVIRTYLDEVQNHDILALIPKKQIVDDEKTEL